MSINHPFSRARLLVSALLASLLLSGNVALLTAHAADAPSDAQEQIRQQERERAQREQLAPEPDVRLEQAEPAAPITVLPSDESPCFTIHSIALTGDASAQFQWALPFANQKNDPAIGRCLGSQGINIVMKRLQNAIVARGFVTTRVLAAPQDLNSGVLTLTLIPGRIHAIRFTPDTSQRATQWNAIAARPGDILNLRDIEQSLENFKRVPTADADIKITPADIKTDTKNSDHSEVKTGEYGSTEPGLSLPGLSDLVISWKQAFPLRLTLTADNSGIKSTGKNQGSVTISGDDLLSLNDLFYISYNHDLGGRDPGSRGSHGTTVSYSIPFGNWLLGLNSSNYEYYQAVAGANQTYLYSGTSTNSDVRLSRVVWRDAVRKTTLSGRLWMRSSSNFIDDTEIQVQHRRMAGWELGINEREFIGDATLDVNLALRQGTGMLGSIPAPEESFGEGTSRPRMIVADVQFNLPFSIANQRLRYSLSARGQSNQTPLVPQDRFAIGGFYTVRGFDGENVLSAERGLLLRNDLGLSLGATGQELYLGLDYGEVGGQSADLLVGKRLAGAVVGLRGGVNGLNSNVSWDVFLGEPIMKPDVFQTARSNVGLNVIWAY